MRDEMHAAAALTAATGLRYVHTPKRQPARVDAIVASVEEGEAGRVITAEAVAEMKCRSMTLEEFNVRCAGELLVTFDKLVAGREAARILRVPFWVLLWLSQDRVLLRQTIADAAGEFVANFRTSNTVTAATINGGEATRCNAFVWFGNADRLA
jgi:predicted transcriptional regulator